MERLDLLPFFLAAGGVLVVLLILSFANKTRKSGQRVRKQDLLASLQNEKLKADIILETIEDGVALIDSSYTIRSFNNGAVKITGYSQEEATDMEFSDFISLLNSKGEPYSRDLNPIRRVFVEKKNVRDNMGEIKTKNGNQLPVFISTSPIVGENGEVEAVVSVFRDVSEERGAENQRAEFISTASHEMRTPVAAIEGYLALATNEAVCKIDSKAREYLDKAHASTQHLGHLFQDLLTAAKSEDGRLVNHPQIVNVTDFIKELTEGVKFTAQKKNLLVEFTIGQDPSANHVDTTQTAKKVAPLYYVWADPDRLREVVTNLFDNAIKYTKEGKIGLSVTGNNEVVQIRVSDTGIGIKEEDLPHLFQKFYRVDNSDTRTVGGTGLGLFICRKIVELYNGKIWAESTFGKGTTFIISLPRISADHARQLQASQAATVEASAQPTSTISN